MIAKTTDEINEIIEAWNKADALRIMTNAESVTVEARNYIQLRFKDRDNANRALRTLQNRNYIIDGLKQPFQLHPDYDIIVKL